MENGYYTRTPGKIADGKREASYDDNDEEQLGIADESGFFAFNVNFHTVSAGNLLLQSGLPVVRNRMLQFFGEKLISRHEAPSSLRSELQQSCCREKAHSRTTVQLTSGIEVPRNANINLVICHQS